jgi:hypothetical protein
MIRGNSRFSLDNQRSTMSTQRSTVVAVFEDRYHADKAVTHLLNAGFRQDQIGVAMRHDEKANGARTAADSADTHTHVGSGAIAGVLTGLGLGTLAGLGVLAGVVPVVGPAIAAGTLGIIVSNAAAGAGIAGLVGALVGAGVPEHEAKYYDSEFEAGKTIVTVNAGPRYDDASSILRMAGGYDMSTSRASAATATV